MPPPSPQPRPPRRRPKAGKLTPRGLALLSSLGLHSLAIAAVALAPRGKATDQTARGPAPLRLALGEDLVAQAPTWAAPNLAPEFLTSEPPEPLSFELQPLESPTLESLPSAFNEEGWPRSEPQALPVGHGPALAMGLQSFAPHPLAEAASETAPETATAAQPSPQPAEPVPPSQAEPSSAETSPNPAELAEAAERAQPTGGGDGKPRLLEAPEPNYPRRARLLDQEGSVLIRLSIAPSGAILETQVLESSGHALLDQAALEAVKRWRFASSENPAACTLEHRFHFRLSNP